MFKKFVLALALVAAFSSDFAFSSMPAEAKYRSITCFI